MSRQVYCHECGSIFTQSRHDACFCRTSCRKAYHNRAMVRGEQIYHLFRVMRRERALAKEMNVWTEMCRLELMWYEEDANRPPHSRRWNAPKKHLAALGDNGRLMKGDVLQQAYSFGRKSAGLTAAA